VHQPRRTSHYCCRLPFTGDYMHRSCCPVFPNSNVKSRPCQRTRKHCRPIMRISMEEAEGVTAFPVTAGNPFQHTVSHAAPSVERLPSPPFATHVLKGRSVPRCLLACAPYLIHYRSITDYIVPMQPPNLLKSQSQIQNIVASLEPRLPFKNVFQ
jgi:hypothetical protein